MFKVGSQLFTSAGPRAVARLAGFGYDIFLDLKFHDIPNTVAHAVAAAVRLPRVRLMTLHASGGLGMMKAAREAAGTKKNRPALLAVTVLTSFDEQDVRDDGSAFTLSELVERRVGHAISAGMNGIVCSSLEIARVRAMTGPKMTLVIPGVRSAGKSTGDQKRVATPADAIASGADYLVVGRQVTRAEDPRGELLRVLDEVSEHAH